MPPRPAQALRFRGSSIHKAGAGCARRGAQSCRGRAQRGRRSGKQWWRRREAGALAADEARGGGRDAVCPAGEGGAGARQGLFAPLRCEGGV